MTSDGEPSRCVQPSMLPFPRAALAVAGALALALAGCQDPVAPAVVPTAIVASSSSSSNGRWLVRLRDEGSADIETPARAKLARANGRLVRTFAGAIRGFAADLTDDAARALAADPDVASVEPDLPITAAGVQLGADWGLDRLDQTALPLTGTYGYGETGAGATVYILDSGIELGHPELAGRATAGYDAVTAGGNSADCNGHGTHVAGLAAGSSLGVARGARIVAVRVLDCALHGSVSQAVAALSWVTQQKHARPAEPMVANLSLEAAGGSATLDAAVNAAIAAGVTVVVAAGNGSTSACANSPSRVPQALTIAASDYADRFAGYSNSGPCVDLVAPGSSVLSAWIGGGTRYMTGTSQAAPFVAGAAALYLSTHPAATPADVATAIVAGATPGVVSGAPAGTPTRLLNLAFVTGPDGFGPRPQDRPRIGRR